MGRFYTGDIEGKFWFAVQSSDDASFFGGNEEDVEEDGNVYEIQYFFDKEDMEGIDDGLETCMYNILSISFITVDVLETYFESIDGYNDEIVSKALSIGKDKVKPLLEWYARYVLGKKIKECVESTGQCSFSAEL